MRGKMEKTEYLTSAIEFLGKATEEILDGRTPDRFPILHFAIGTELLLKSLLQKINPTFIYKDTSFKNCIRLEYSGLKIDKKNDEISTSPDADTVSLRSAVQRYLYFSEITNKNANLLFHLDQLRGSVVHCSPSGEELKKGIEFIRSELYLILDLLIKEQAISGIVLNRELLEKAAAKQREAKFSETMEALRAKHLKIYKSKKDSDRMIGDFKLWKLLESDGTREVECPACGKTACLTEEVEYDYSSGEISTLGLIPKELECPHCGMKIIEYAIFDYFGIK